MPGVVSTTLRRPGDPCFSGIARVVVCPSDPPTTKQPTHVVRLTLQKPLPAGGHPKAEPTAGLPRLIRATSDLTCEPNSEAAVEFGSQPLQYVCRPTATATKVGYLAGSPFRGAAPWVMVFVPLRIEESVADTTALAEVWFW